MKDQDPKVLFYQLPVLLITGMQYTEKRPGWGFGTAAVGTKLDMTKYSCPLYMYPVRTGSRERPSFMIMVDLKGGVGDSDFWIKRGTALLLSLAIALCALSHPLAAHHKFQAINQRIITIDR